LECEVLASGAKSALAQGQDCLESLLQVLAARQIAFVSIASPQVTRLDLPEVAPLEDPPPFEVATGHVTQLGEQWLAAALDPDGSRRRTGEVLNLSFALTLTRPSIAAEIPLYQARTQWSPRVRRAAQIFHRSQAALSQDTEFLLAYAALEVLVEHTPAPVLQVALPSKAERRRLRSCVEDLLQQRAVPKQHRNRLLARFDDAQATSPLDALLAYLARLDLPADRSEHRWLRTQRGGYVHAGELDGSDEANQRRAELVSTVGRALAIELSLASDRREK